jgi:hypothetical protein
MSHRGSESCKPTTKGQAPLHRAVIYCRISVDSTGEAAGVRRQEADCRTYCKRTRTEVVEVMTDNDISASTYSRKARPGYRRALELGVRGLSLTRSIEAAQGHDRLFAPFRFCTV